MEHDLCQPRIERQRDVIRHYQIDDFDIWTLGKTSALGMDPRPIFDEFYAADMTIAVRGLR